MQIPSLGASAGALHLVGTGQENLPGSQASPGPACPVEPPALEPPTPPLATPPDPPDPLLPAPPPVAPGSLDGSLVLTHVAPTHACPLRQGSDAVPSHTVRHVPATQVVPSAHVPPGQAACSGVTQVEPAFARRQRRPEPQSVSPVQ